MLLAVNYHYIRPLSDYPARGVYGISPEAFETQLEILGSMGKFVGVAEIRDSIQGGRPLPERAIIVTLDDGLREQFEYAFPILKKVGVPGCFFVSTWPTSQGGVLPVHKLHLLLAQVEPRELIETIRAIASEAGFSLCHELDGATVRNAYPYDEPEIARLKYLINQALPQRSRDLIIEIAFEELFPLSEADFSRRLYMDSSQFKVLASHDMLGTHTHQHYALAQMSTEKIDEQIRLSLDYLEAVGGRRVYALSYPYGSPASYSQDVVSIAGQLGVTVAFTMERAKNVILDKPLTLARIDCNDAPGGKSCNIPPADFFDSLPAATW